MAHRILEEFENLLAEKMFSVLASAFEPILLTSYALRR
jgi:hypothetical protein